MVSIFYQTSTTAITSGNYSIAPYFSSSKTAATFNNYLGNSTEILGIVTQSYQKAPITDSYFPVIIFSHGLGSSRFMYTAQLEALASQGWILIVSDHPYDALITEFPDGNVIRMDSSVLDDFPSKMTSLVEVRVADVEFIASAFQNSTTLSQLLGLDSSAGAIRGNRIGIFGHSLGGNTAAQAVANSSTFLVAPILIEIEAQDHPHTSDAAFAKFWSHLRGFRREFMVNSTVHIAFMDIPVLRDLLGEAFPVQLRN